MFSPKLDVGAVAAFLRDRFAEVAGVEPIGAGQWSQAFSFRMGPHARVIRFGEFSEDYAKDRVASGFAAPELPVPETHEIGEAFGVTRSLREPSVTRSMGLPRPGTDECSRPCCDHWMSSELWTDVLGPVVPRARPDRPA